MKDPTPRADGELNLLNEVLPDEFSVFNTKLDDTQRAFKRVEEPLLYPIYGPNPSLIETPSQTPIEDSSVPISNLRKRRPVKLDTIKAPPLKLKHNKQFNIKTEDDESEERADLDIQMPPEKQAILNLLNKLLKHSNIVSSDVEGLSGLQLEIIKSIVLRKYGINISQKDIEDKKKLLSELNELDSKQKIVKRSEENNKLVFKRAIKSLITSYKSSHYDDMKDMKKKEYEIIIVRDYFGYIPIPESSRNKKTEFKVQESNEKTIGSRMIANVQKGGEKLRKFVINPNTINARYIKFVFRSTKFKEFFDIFIENLFISDYKRNRPNKIKKIIDSTYDNFSRKKANQAQILIAKDCIEKNPKFKLPWSDKELELCIHSTKDYIQRVFRSRDNRRKGH